MSRITEYIIRKKNVKKPAYVGFAEGSRVVQARYLGYLNACNQNSIEVDSQLQFTRPSNRISFSYSMIEEVINNLPYIPDAFVCEDDDVAKNVALILLQKDPNLAKHIVITGFNDIVEPDFFRDDIISVGVKMEQLGKRLVKSVIDRINEPDMDISFTTIATYPMVDD